MHLYIHIPFCKKKCNYCDFVSYAGKEELIDKYVKALGKEIKGLMDPSTGLGVNWGTEGLDTVYFGGGTPTLLEPEHFNKIINSLISHYSLVIRHSEISIEANPGTADKAKLKELKQLGINRISIGVQSFNDKHLSALGRIHNAATAKQFYLDARAAGFDNINLDLIFALPNQTLDEWKADLKTAIDLDPNHLSTYNLQIEENTPFWSIYGEPRSSFSGGPHKLPDEETDLAMYEYTIDTLKNTGYRHYEISNFAKPGFECRHNINYWKMGNWLGIGAGAHSHVDGRRWSNTDNIKEYIDGSKPVHHDSDQKKEALFMGLRLLEGISKDKFTGFEKEVEELAKDDLLEEKNGNYRLTRRGLFLGNLVFEKFV